MEQLKRRCLHNFVRETREDLLKENKERKEQQAKEEHEEKLAMEKERLRLGD